MTLDTFGESMTFANPEKPLNIGSALREVITTAYRDDRLVCGIFECAKLLALGPEDVMVCLLPAVSVKDVSVRIQHTLIEAHCRENGIHVIKTDSAEKVGSLLNNNNCTADTNLKNKTNSKSNQTSGVEKSTISMGGDFSCVLVKMSDCLRQEDDFLMAYCERMPNLPFQSPGANDKSDYLIKGGDYCSRYCLCPRSPQSGHTQFTWG